MSVTDVLQSIGMDVPDRERLGWLGDVSQYSEAGMRMLDMPAFFEHQLRNEADTAALLGGWLSSISPLMFRGKFWGKGDPAWVSALPGIALHLYQETGDPIVLRRVFVAIRTQVEQYLAAAASNRPPGLLAVPGRKQQYQTFGDYINLACTHAIYQGATKAGIINDTGIPCDPVIGDNSYFLQALDGTSLSGSISTTWTGLSWICAGICMCEARPSPVCA